jgi:N4-gp56 family major capsid protein
LVTKVTESTLQNQDAVLNEVGDLLGLSLRMTEDQLMRDMLMASAAQYNCSGGGNGDTPTNLDDSDLEEVTALLAEEDAKMIFSSIVGEDRIGTGPQRDAYLALGHIRLLKDIQNLTNFFSKWNYPNNNRSLPAEWGSVDNIRFMLSSVGAIERNASDLGADVYDIFVQGLEGIGCVKQDNFTSRFLYRPPIFSDPLFQNVTLGYVTAQAPVLLNDLWVEKVRCTLNS